MLIYKSPALKRIAFRLLAVMAHNQIFETYWTEFNPNSLKAGDVVRFAGVSAPDEDCAMVVARIYGETKRWAVLTRGEAERHMEVRAWRELLRLTFRQQPERSFDLSLPERLSRQEFVKDIKHSEHGEVTKTSGKPVMWWNRED